MNTQTQEALKMAIELINALELYDQSHGLEFWQLDASLGIDLDKVQNACKEALSKEQLDEMQAITEKEYIQEQEPSELKMSGYDLDGVIADIEFGHPFDEVCLNTIARVRKVIYECVEAPSQKQEPITFTKDEVQSIIDNWSHYDYLDYENITKDINEYCRRN